MFKQITYSSDPSVIGVDNGFSQLEFEENYLKKNRGYAEIERLTLAYQVDDFIKNQNGIKFSEIHSLKGVLYKKAKATDFMVFSPYFFGCKYLISQKVLDCLEEEGVTKEQYRLIKADIENVNANYYLLFVPILPNSDINFTDSLIYHKDDILSEQKSYLPIGSYNEYQQTMKTDPFHSFARIGLPMEYQERDIISVQGATDLFFSERLIKRLQEAEVTNFRIPDRQIELVFSESEEACGQSKL